MADGNEWAAERLAREPGCVLDSALRQTGSGKVFAEHLSQLHPHTVEGLRLGKKTDQLLEEAASLNKQLDRYAYGAPAIRFSDDDIDQARAAGVVIEFERSAPIIVDRPLFRELAKGAIKRTVFELQQRVETRAAEKQAKGRVATATSADPLAEIHREEQRQLRELSEQAHGVNLDIGTGLLHGLSTVDPSDLDVARFFVYALLGSDHDESPYTQTGDRVARLAVSGIRLVIGDFRTDVTKTLQSGARGKLRIDYGNPREPQEPIKWMWRFIVCRVGGYAEPACGVRVCSAPEGS